MVISLLLVLKICFCLAIITAIFFAIRFLVRFFRNRKKSFSDLLKIAPAGYTILNSYAKSLGLLTELQSFRESLKIYIKMRGTCWFARGRIIYVPRCLLDNNEPEFWDLNLICFSHEIGHTQDGDENCPLAIVKNWSLCPANEICAEKEGIIILKNLDLMPEEKILKLTRKGFPKCIAEILKENKKCAKAICKGKCPRLNWEEIIKAIDYGI